MRAIDGEPASSLRNDSTRRARAVAPIDGRGEVARRCIRIGVGEGRNRRAADRYPFRPLTLVATAVAALVIEHGGNEDRAIGVLIPIAQMLGLSRSRTGDPGKKLSC